MEIKVFGKKVFEFRSSKSSLYFQNSADQLAKSEFLPDFHSMSANQNSFGWGEVASMNIPTAINEAVVKGSKKVVVEEKKVVEKTPKEVYGLKLLDDTTFKINTDSKYIEEQLQSFKDKLDLSKVSESDFTRGITEISSIMSRLENRKKYGKFKDFFDNYAYTTSTKINELVKNHDYLKLGKSEQFIADFPKEAIAEMKSYTTTTKELCGKKPIFYVIANKKDFEKSEKRRDPILLAQSPFGHFWQILGAWDEEMLFLEEL
jgi:hypothetical protein